MSSKLNIDYLKYVCSNIQSKIGGENNLLARWPVSLYLERYGFVSYRIRLTKILAGRLMIPNSLEARDIAHMIHPYTNLVKHRDKGPMVMESAKGVWITDHAGNRYIEGLAGLWCCGLGYGEERLVKTASAQMQKLSFSHVFAHKSHPPAIELAGQLCALGPGAGSERAMDKVLFANSGSEANDTAIKVIRYYMNAIGKPKKKKIISRLKGYHGVTLASASLTGLPILHADFDLPMEGVLHTACPHHYRAPDPDMSEQEFCADLVKQLEELIDREGPETIAAFIAEPVMGAGGVIVPPDGYFEAIQAVLRRHNILMVADEVICGFGRTGNMFGSETLSIDPDIVTVAKQLTSAYFPLSATMLNREISEAVIENSGRHGAFGMGYTYSGHPVGTAIASEVLKIYEERSILDHVNSISPYFQTRLKEFSDHPLVGEARGLGLIGALELVADKKTRQSFDPAQGMGAKVGALCEKHGLIVRALAGDIVAVCPPLIITHEEIEMMMDRLASALDEAC